MVRKVGIHTWQLIKKTVQEWMNHSDLYMMSAALSYYAIFSLPGMLIIIIFAAGNFFGTEAVNGQIFSEIREYIGDQGAMQIQEMIANAHISRHSVLATIVGTIILIYSSTGVMYQLQQALDKIWDVKPKPNKAILKFLRDRSLSFLMILLFGVIFMGSMIFTSMVSYVTDWISLKLFSLNSFALNTINFLLTLVTDTIIFTMMFKIVPDVKINWKHVWVGALVTAVLFDGGKFLIGYYISRSDPASTYGAAGSLILILLWVSYSSLIIFFGAIFTKVYIRHFGEIARPEDYAVKVPPENTAQIP